MEFMDSRRDGLGANLDRTVDNRNRPMTSPGSTTKALQTKARLGLGIALSLLFGISSLMTASAAKPSQTAWPVRNFLPPIASINPKLLEHQSHQTDNDLNPVALSAVSSPAIHTTPKVDRLATKLDVATHDEQSQALLDIQKEVNQADLEYLWQATVEKNPVIRFSLEKLATPADLQKKQSSKFLSKSLSLLLSGATMGATMLPGASAYQNMTAVSLNQAMQNLVNGNIKPAPNTLSATEQIQLAGLLDELKLKLIHNYQDYKATLQALTEAREITMKNNNLYSKALGSKNDLSVMAASSAYYKSLMQETTLRQKAKLYRLQLERLAGTEAVSRLELSPHVSLDGKTANSTDEIGPTPELNTSATVMPTSKPNNPTASIPDFSTLPQAMEIGPSLDTDANPLIGPPLPALSHNRGRTVKTRQAAVKNYGDGQPLPIPDKIMEHPATQIQTQPKQEKPKP